MSPLGGKYDKLLRHPCSICGKPLREGEDIVRLCPECGTITGSAMPKEGRCVHAAQHGSFDYEARHVQPATDVRRCPNCRRFNTAETCSAKTAARRWAKARPRTMRLAPRTCPAARTQASCRKNGFNGSIPEPLRTARGRRRHTEQAVRRHRHARLGAVHRQFGPLLSVPVRAHGPLRPQGRHLLERAVLRALLFPVPQNVELGAGQRSGAVRRFRCRRSCSCWWT